MPKPKFVKPLLIGCACCIPVAIVAGLSINWDHRQFISSVGSSGVKPFIEAFGKEYVAANPKIDVQVESGGTTFAIEEVAKGLTNIGNASNNPYYTINKPNGYKDQWSNKKTCTLGYEGLVILYKMPDGLSEEAQEWFDIVITKDNILQLYAVFSGFNENRISPTIIHEWNEEETKEFSSIYHYMTDTARLHLKTEKDKEICKNTPIIPFVRSGGNTAANSSIAFTYYSNLTTFEKMTPNQQNAFRGGQYGSARLYYETEESNARAWEMFSKINKPGSMVYLTTGFVKNKSNQEAIKAAGYRLAGYLPADSVNNPVYLEAEGDLNKICVKSGYNWYRPINIMLDLDNQLSKDFVNWIYSWDNAELKEKHFEIIRNNGAKPLTTNQYESMLGSNKQLFETGTDDITLLQKRIDAGETEYSETYGAEDIWE